MPEELGPAEKSLLRNMDEFNRTIAATGWHVRDKVIREDLSRIMFRNSSMESVEMEYTLWNRALLDNSRFTSVRFFQCKFDGATLHGVEFTDCEFDVTSFSGASLMDCRFRNCRASELTARQTAFQTCSFEAFQDRAGVFGPSVMRDCRFEACDLQNSSFDRLEASPLVFRKSTLRLVVFDGMRGGRLEMSEDTLTQCAFGEGKCEDFAIERSKLNGVSFNGFEAGNLVIKSCPTIEALNVVRSSWSHSTVSDCAAVSELTVRESQLTNFSLERCQVAYFDLKQSRVLGVSQVSGCQIAGLNLTASNLQHVVFANCSLHLYLTLDGATLDGLELRDMIYAPGLKLREADVKYINNSARFRQ